MDGAFAHAQNVVDAARLQIGDGGRRDHAAVGNDADAADGEALAQSVDHRQQEGDVGGVAGEHLGADRPARAIDHHRQQHLLQVRPVVLGVAMGAEGRAAGALERQGWWCP